MLRILFFGVLFFLLYRAFRRYFRSRENIGRGSEESNGGTIDEMVQDPSCKAYIPKRTALRKNIGGREFFYCSQECAAKHEEEMRNRK